MLLLILPHGKSVHPLLARFQGQNTPIRSRFPGKMPALESWSSPLCQMKAVQRYSNYRSLLAIIFHRACCRRRLSCSAKETIARSEQTPVIALISGPNGVPIASEVGDSLRIDKEGRYSVLVTDASGCSGTSSELSVRIVSRPPKPVIIASGTTLTCSPAANRYVWSENGTIRSTDTAQTIAFDPTTTYQVTIIDSNGCSNTSDVFDGKGPLATASSVFLPPHWCATRKRLTFQSFFQTHST